MRLYERLAGRKIVEWPGYFDSIEHHKPRKQNQQGCSESPLHDHHLPFAVRFSWPLGNAPDGALLAGCGMGGGGS